MLEQAAAMKISPDDEDLVEYITVLREGILEAYIGVVQGLVIRACLTILVVFEPNFTGYMMVVVHHS